MTHWNSLPLYSPLRNELTSMLIKIQLDELLSQSYFAFDVYDAKGQLIFRAGDEVSLQKLEAWVGQGLFRLTTKLPMEWLIEDELPNIDPMALPGLLGAPVQSLEPEMAGANPIISEEEAEPFLNAMFAFWRKLEKGETADIALLEVMGEALISEVITNMGQLRYLNQLRVRDPFTYSHTLDVTAISIALGAKLGLNHTDLQTLALGALLHDVGKLLIPKPIMFKESRLTDTEFEVMQTHPELGYHILRNELKLPEEVTRPALEHQELYAGGGYPLNIKGDEIHFFSQIVKIADVYDALTSVRPYKDAIPSDQAIKIMLFEGGKSFNPEMLRVFIAMANYEDDLPSELAMKENF